MKPSTVITWKASLGSTVKMFDLQLPAELLHSLLPYGTSLLLANNLSLFLTSQPPYPLLFWRVWIGNPKEEFLLLSVCSRWHHRWAERLSRVCICLKKTVQKWCIWNLGQLWLVSALLHVRVKHCSFKKHFCLSPGVTHTGTLGFFFFFFF